MYRKMQYARNLIHNYDMEQYNRQGRGLIVMVFVKYNNIQLELRQQKKKKTGKTYDLMYLSDVESNYKWITERIMFIGRYAWMDIHEYLEVKGKTSGSNKKRRTS